MDMRQRLTIRRSHDGDSGGVFRAHRSAFGSEEGQEIVDLVEALFDDLTAQPMLSLVAACNEEILGHVLFTKAEISGDGKTLSTRLLAPLGVRSDHQQTGIGSALVNEGLQLLASERVDLVFVLGDPAYYGRFGFTAAIPQGFVPPHTLSDAYKDAWMVVTLGAKKLAGTHGDVRCADSISDPHYWQE